MMIVECRKSPPGPPSASGSHGHRKPWAPALRHASRSTMPASATAVLDASGSLRTLENINSIAATVTATDATIPVTGRAIALDLRANTAGVTLRQYANSDTAITPTITGDVLFGSGAGRLELLAGVLNGAVAFGSGADSLVINGGVLGFLAWYMFVIRPTLQI